MSPVGALREQLAHRPSGAKRVGWKVGAVERERIGGESAAGGRVCLETA